MLSSWRASTNVICNAAKSFLHKTPNLFTQQSRTTVILKRKYPLPLYKKGRAPHKFKHKNFIYEVVENTNFRPVVPLDIILTEYVAGYGEKGDRLSLRPDKAYKEFLLPGLAVYASPENIKKYTSTEKVREKTYSSLYVTKTLKALSEFCLMVNMSIVNPWVIEKWHIRASFRAAGVHVTDESITLPPKEISGPNLNNEGKEFYVTITINKTEQAKVRCRLHHDSLILKEQLPFVDEYWKIPGEAIFPEDQEVLDSLPKPLWDRLRKQEDDEDV